MAETTTKWILAFGLACPACGAGVFLVVAGLFGIGAVAFQSALLGLAVAVLMALWARNIWVRRGESCRMDTDGVP
jgi:ABC-type Mn2+/Zn2+ transport system permease subunit